MSPATTVDCQCGSSQQANHFVANLITAGAIDVGIACGVEMMSRVGLGANVMNGPGVPRPDDWTSTCPTSSRAPSGSPRTGTSAVTDVDAFALRSQQRTRGPAWDEGRFDAGDVRDRGCLGA
jgi:acetyl-CoA C-acetyltransferase